jgi:hypothetical protein
MNQYIVYIFKEQFNYRIEIKSKILIDAVNIDSVGFVFMIFYIYFYYKDLCIIFTTFLIILSKCFVKIPIPISI